MDLVTRAARPACALVFPRLPTDCVHAPQVLAHALMGLLLLHRAYRDPWSLLAHTNGADPFRLAAFRIVHSAVYNALQQSAEYSRSSFPPLHVLYGVTALVPPECLAALAAARGPFESLDGPLDSAPGIPELSKQHLTMVVEVRYLSGICCTKVQCCHTQAALPLSGAIGKSTGAYAGSLDADNVCDAVVVCNRIGR